jgi:hypothetical protein
VSINKAFDDLSPIEKDHLFIVLEEKIDYPANLDLFARMQLRQLYHRLEPCNGGQGPFKKKICE